MNCGEFSAEFDVLYNNITSNQAPGLNEYEKSVFLTKAQSQLVSEFFNHRTDGLGGGFDGSQKRQYDFSELIKTKNLYNINSFTERVTPTEKLDRRSLVYLFPQDYFLAVNEILSDEKWQYSVQPISYAEYQRLMLKPYNFPVKRGAWRFFTDTKTCNYTHKDSNYIDTNAGEEENDFILLSTYGNKKIRFTPIFKNGVWDPSDQTDTFIVDNTSSNRTTIKFKCTPKNYSDSVYCKVICNVSESTITSTVNINVYTNVEDLQDDSVIDIITQGFTQLKKSSYWNNHQNWYIIKGALILDGLENIKVPSGKTYFTDSDEQGWEATVIDTHLIQVPTIELIGKFTGNIQYKIRYVHALHPIILEDIDNYGTDLTIDGISKKTECELPEEAHHEILERAVTLAKIAWQGGTMTGAAQQQAKNG